MCSRESEFKSILFSLVYFHAVVIERRKFGPQGWNRSYPYNTGDLTISVNVLYNYLEANAKVDRLAMQCTNTAFVIVTITTSSKQCPYSTDNVHLLQVPWTDLRYLFGQIMYGGHITDDWDCRLCKTYLEVFMSPEQVRV